jgi:hypothetical protein
MAADLGIITMIRNVYSDLARTLAWVAPLKTEAACLEDFPESAVIEGVRAMGKLSQTIAHNRWRDGKLK